MKYTIKVENGLKNEYLHTDSDWLAEEVAALICDTMRLGTVVTQTKEEKVHEFFTGETV